VALIMLMALFAVWRFGLQLRRLTEDMRRATALQLDDVRSGREGSFVSEIRDICVEFDKLITALKSLQKYLPQDQVGFLLSSNLEATIACMEQEITIFFLDIVNFTSTVESLSDSDMLRFYGDIMTILTQRITDEQGILDKYIGDAVMAFWNMPRAVADHETKAVRAALACRAAIPMLADRGWTVDFRSVINTAVCQVGNFGSWDRLNYTAIGDGVNVASRLEALCKAYHCPILISETTHKGLALDTFVTRLVDKVAVKGKDMITVLHQVVGYPEDVLPSALPGLLDYEKAFTLYCSGSYSAAQQAWRKLGMLGDQTAQMMADRLENDRPTSGGVWKWNTK
jgi:adenylate cyclase